MHPMDPMDPTPSCISKAFFWKDRQTDNDRHMVCTNMHKVPRMDWIDARPTSHKWTELACTRHINTVGEDSSYLPQFPIALPAKPAGDLWALINHQRMSYDLIHFHWHSLTFWECPMIAACSTFYIDDHRCNLEKVALHLDCFRRLLSLAEQEAAMKTVGKPRNRLVKLYKTTILGVYGCIPHFRTNPTLANRWF